jgi:hypothetical protein
MLSQMILPAAAIAGSVLAYGFFTGGFKHSHSHAEAKQITVQVLETPKRSGPMITKVEPQVVELAPVIISEEPVLETKAVEVEVVETIIEEVSEPVLEPKSLEVMPTVETIEQELLEVLEAPAEELPLPEVFDVAEVVVEETAPVEISAPVEIIAPVEVPAEAPRVRSSAEATFEQYRQAMLHTGPRDLEKQARVEMQSKGGVGNSALWRAQTASLRKSLGSDDAADFLERANISVNDRVISSFNAYRHA